MHEFNITIIDKLGKEILPINFLCRLTTKDDRHIIDDSFSNGYLLSIAIHTHWYVDIKNYVVAKKIHPHFSPKENRLLDEKNFNFSWIVWHVFYIRLGQVMRCYVIKDETYDILNSYYGESWV